MGKGRHLLIDCRRVAREVCLDDERMLQAMSRAASAAGARVISQVRYAFGKDSPPGFAAVVMLDESHCSAHSYADDGLMALDIFTCGNVRPEDVLAGLHSQIDLGEVAIRSVDRFNEDVTSMPVDGGRTSLSSDLDESEERTRYCRQSL